MVLRLSLRRLTLIASAALTLTALLPALALSHLGAAPRPSPASTASPARALPRTPMAPSRASVAPLPQVAVPAPPAEPARSQPVPPPAPPPADRSPLSPQLKGEVAAAAARSHLPPELILAVIMAESDGQTRAVSPTGARGLMQLEPPTARSLGVRDAFNPSENVLAGSRYLAGLLAQYEKEQAACLRSGVHADSDSGVGACPSPLIEALAAYNAGPAAVKRYGGLPPYPETQRYVARVLEAFASYAQP